jgi:hypothetical protein
MQCIFTGTAKTANYTATSIEMRGTVVMASTFMVFAVCIVSRSAFPTHQITSKRGGQTVIAPLS